MLRGGRQVSPSWRPAVEAHGDDLAPASTDGGTSGGEGSAFCDAPSGKMQDPPEGLGGSSADGAPRNLRDVERVLALYHEQLCCRLSDQVRAGQEHLLMYLRSASHDDASALSNPEGTPGALSLDPELVGGHWQDRLGVSLWSWRGVGPGSEQLDVKACAGQGEPCSEDTEKSTKLLDCIDEERQQRAQEHAVAEARRSKESAPQDDEDAPTGPTTTQVNVSGVVSRIVNNPHFELVFGAAICMNAVFIGAETNYAAYSLGDDHLGFKVGGFIFTGLFATELALRLVVERFKFFTTCEAWNYIDAFIVLSSLAEVVIEIISACGGMPTDQGGAMGSTTQFRVLRIIRVTRLIRVLRIARIVRFIRALRTLVHQIVHTLKSLVWALLLLLLVLFLFGILFTQGVSEHRLTRASESPSAAEAVRREMDDFDHPLTLYWSTLPRSMFTLFKATTGGVSWHDVSQPLSDLSGWSVGLFVVYICFVEFCVLNVVTGVFCQNAIDSAAHDAELVTQHVLQQKDMYVRRLSQIFEAMDSDASGAVTIQEFKTHLEDETLRAYFDSLELDTSDVWTLFKLMDSNEGADIDLNEFIESCMRLRGTARGVDMAKLMHEHSHISKRQDKFMRDASRQLAMIMQAVGGQHMPKHCRQEFAS